MLIAVTSPRDPDLAVLASSPFVGLILPQTLSERGWVLGDGGASETLVRTSRGEVLGARIKGVINRIGGVSEADLEHVTEEDRGYVAAEMTAFLAALVEDLPCPRFNAPTATSLLGPPFTRQHWWRAAAAAGAPVCARRDASCDTDSRDVVLLDGTPLDGGDADGVAAAVLASAHVRFASVWFCRAHGGLRGVSLAPRLDARRLSLLRERCA